MFFFIVQLVSAQFCENIYHEGRGIVELYKTVTVDRTVVIGDLHGDYKALIEILKFSNVDKADLVVSIGDTIGRGQFTREILDFFMNTGNTLHLLGNHEHLNLNLQFNYVADEDFDSFGGVENRRKEFSINGKFWDYLVRRPLIVKLGRVLMVHAGLSLKHLKEVGVDEGRNVLNSRFQDVYYEESPIWYRGYARGYQWRACQELDEVLKIMNCDFMVMGHTVFDEITTKCSGKAIFIDTGISYIMSENPSALEILQSNGETLSIKAIYPKRQVTLYPFP